MKRSSEQATKDATTPLKGKKRTNESIEDENIEELAFEDPYEDEFEEEEGLEGLEGDVDDEGEEEENNMEASVQPTVQQAWRPGIDKVEEGETLEYDPRAYIMYHSMQTEWPCLSFDILRDNLGDNRQRFPLSMYMVTGSQADKVDKNKITLLKLSDMNKTHVPNNEDDEESDDDVDGTDDDPTIEHMNINHYGGVNRIRSMPQSPGIIATMSDTKQVHIYDLNSQLNSLMSKGPKVANTATTKPIFSSLQHIDEGFAIDWSLNNPGFLATGDCQGTICLFSPVGNSGVTGSWKVEGGRSGGSGGIRGGKGGHTGSVEDIQWSPTEKTVFISASSDKTVKIWDTRDFSKSQISFQAHNEDVNVISWNRNVSYLLASGSDDGSFKVWDLRMAAQQKQASTPLAHFTFHKAPITSIQWAPHDESMVVLSSADHQVTVWDLSVEADEEGVKDPNLEDYPAQLLFLHLGQHNVKEVHYHPQIPGTIISTAEDSFNIFKPAITES